MTDSTVTITPDTTPVAGAVAVVETIRIVDETGAVWLHTPPRPRPDGMDLTDLRGADKHVAVTTAMARGASPDYGQWLSRVRSAAGCTNPVRLAGKFRTATVNTTRGEVTNDGPERSTADMPDGVIYKACGNRRASVCPSCSEIYRADAYQLVLAGMRGGKGVPETVSGHPAVFATVTAPGFGIVHTPRTNKKGQPALCRARRTPEICPHGIDMRCMTRHCEGDERLGRPLCPDCYDYDHHAVWNGLVGELLRRTTMKANRELGKWARRHGLTQQVVNPNTGKVESKVPVRISFGKVAEFQRRGLVHFHILARFDGIHPLDPDVVVPPPEWATVFLLKWILERAVADTTWRTPPLVVHGRRGRLLVDRPDGWLLRWGNQVDVRPVRLRGEDKLTGERVVDELDHTDQANQTDKHGRRRLLSGPAVAGYLAKYATKATEAAGHTSRKITEESIDFYANNTHPGRIIEACWRLSQKGRQPADEWRGGWYYALRRWAHMLGYGGHFFSKSRRYSTTFKRLRQARVDYRRAHHESSEHLEENEVLEVIGELVFAGSGWHTTGDAMLANTAAAMAREQRQTGRLEIATSG
ncbi:replication initiator [Actinopolymorpha sp. NPDC004070]|uniref:replication initiator n=1 Tax=Actinopolymorpha sp. NPDC004070 TaxID=3154548 RepID=UPI0033BB5DED